MNNFEYLLHRVQQETPSCLVSPKSLLGFLDLTSLNTEDNESVISALCQKAARYSVAAVCVYPAFVALAIEALKKSSVQIATVINFPHGNESLSSVLKSIDNALSEGAQELDIVIPYQQCLSSRDTKSIKNFVSTCKAIMPNQCLKIILESGAFHDRQLLESAALAALEGGADFLKTSTGKISQGASLMTAAVLLDAIQRFGDLTRGFKASGGVREYSQAKGYFLLAQLMMGERWVTAKTFRIGASSLLDELVNMHDE